MLLSFITILEVFTILKDNLIKPYNISLNLYKYKKKFMDKETQKLQLLIQILLAAIKQRVNSSKQWNCIKDV
jgi:hypothetical protein